MPTRPWLGPGLMVLAMAALCFPTGHHPLVDPDEGRNASIALAMIQSGDYLVPRLNGLPYLDKPPLFFVAEGMAMLLVGESELAARLPSVLFAMATVLLTAWFAARLFGRETAWIAGTICAAAPLTIIMARVAIFDSMLSFFIVLALVSFHLAVETGDGSPHRFRPRGSTLIAWSAMAVGVLTKGPVALLIPLLVATPYAIWRRRTGAVLHPIGAIAFLLIVLPWALAVERALPGFLRYGLVVETWERVTTDRLNRGGPPWYFLPYLVAGFFPWIGVVFSAGRRAETREEKYAFFFLALWICLPLLFFSLSNSKRPQYVLPLIPALAILAAWAWTRGRFVATAVRLTGFVWIVIGAALLAASLFELPGEWADYAAVGRRTALLAGSTSILCGVLNWTLSRNRSLALVAMSLPLLLLTTVTAPLIRAVALSRSAAGMAATLHAHLTSQTVLVGIETFTPSLTFYLRRSIRLSSATGEPLRSNYAIHAYNDLTASHAAVLKSGEWWREALGSCSEPMIFLVSKEFPKELAHLRSAGLPLLYEDGKMVARGPCQRELRRAKKESLPAPVSTGLSGGGV